jgi:hypothetical protein
MKNRSFFAIIFFALFFAGFKKENKKESNDLIIGNGQMPNLTKDNSGNLYVVYGSSDSILYSFSNNGGKSFSTPELIAVLSQLTASSMRGPQIAFGKDGIIVLACTKPGNIFSYRKEKSGKWVQTAKVNDIDTVAKEAFMALSADGNNVFAAWLDLRDNKRNKIAGAKSTDGGKTWSKNSIVYTSPETSVCECCKPSVAVQGKNVYVMFRNWLQGKRDLYLIQSTDGGNSFGKASKLGTDSWLLNGCPMDGGGLALNNKGNPETVWRRNNTIYACQPGHPEIAIGNGRGCTMESVNGKNVYAWTENGEVIIRKPQGMKINIGKGQLPLIKSINNEHVLCIWENNKQIHAQIIPI